VERGFSIRNVAAVEDEGDLIGDFFLSEGIGFCLNKRGIGETRE